MQLETIKQQVETNKSFQYWSNAIGLSFGDFSILELAEDNTKFLVLKNGNETIGNYFIYLKNGAVDKYCFDMNN